MEGKVASFAEAWIEKLILAFTPFVITVASFAEAWIENLNGPQTVPQCGVASFAEAWIEKEQISGVQDELGRRLLRGGVD